MPFFFCFIPLLLCVTRSRNSHLTLTPTITPTKQLKAHMYNYFHFNFISFCSAFTLDIIMSTEALRKELKFSPTYKITIQNENWKNTLRAVMGENGWKICLSNSSAMFYYHLLNCMKLTYSRSAFISTYYALLRRHGMANGEEKRNNSIGCCSKSFCL